MKIITADLQGESALTLGPKIFFGARMLLCTSVGLKR